MNISNTEVLLMFSGGLDSTGAFYKLIKDSKKIHVHHINLINIENRSQAEKNAVDKINEYMRNIGDFSYSESTHEMPSWNRNFLWDSDVYNLIAGSICRSFPNIKEVALGLTKTDISSSSVSERIERGKKIFGSFNTKANKLYPVADMTKEEIYNMLPEELRSLTWSCRTPLYKEDKILSCNKCKSCSELKFIPKQQ